MHGYRVFVGIGYAWVQDIYRYRICMGTGYSSVQDIYRYGVFIGSRHLSVQGASRYDHIYLGDECGDGGRAEGQPVHTRDWHLDIP